ncbi:MAG: hypothetical protein ACOX8A_08320 [Thermacetogeniaceae bacterium]|jgi:hypothetical protein
MAERRMFSKTIIDSDAFLDMPASAQALYFHLNMRADDDGFVNNPKKIQRVIGSTDDDLKLLLAKRFILAFESGVIVIKHWKLNNYIRKDRYSPTLYQEEYAQLEEKENGAYTECQALGLPNDNQRLTQVRLGKVRLGKVSKESEAAAPPTPPQKHKYGEYGWVKLTDEERSRLIRDLGEVELERCIAYVDESAQRTSNKNKWRDWNLVLRKCNRECWGQQSTTSAADYEDILATITTSDEVRAALRNWVNMRITKGHPMSEEILRVAKEELDGMANTVAEAVAIINKSTLGGYPVFYKPRE